MGKEKEIKDDEIRIIGGTADGKKHVSRVRVYAVIISSAVVFLAFLLIFIMRSMRQDMHEDVDNDTVAMEYSGMNGQGGAGQYGALQARQKTDSIGDYSLKRGLAYTEHLMDTVNDISLDIYIPHNAEAGLFLGVPDTSDTDIIFAARAADVRADNGKIVGAFVLDGEPLSWGLSKKGFCSIIEGTVTVGVADNSPLFEEATEKEGCFFRQYPLVDNGSPVENAPKGKAIRKAICDRNGEIMVIVSVSPESFHDFSQALADFGVTHAVYLAGGMSFGFFRNEDGVLTLIHGRNGATYENENYILWRSR